MATKPRKEDLIAYLYGELTDAENRQIEEWLKSNPESSKEMEDLKSMRSLMAQVPDQEVLDPLFYTGDGKIKFWHFSRILSNTIIKPAVGLAAAVSFMLFMGYVTNLNISTEKGFLTVSFGGGDVRTEQVDEQQIEQIVQAMLSEQRTLLTSDVQNIEEGLKNQLDSYDNEKNNQFQTTLANDSETSNQVISEFIKQMQEDNLEYLERYLEVTSRNQEQNLQLALTEFAQILARQREEDLNRIEYNLTTLKETQDLQKFQTDQALATILNTVSNENQN